MSFFRLPEPALRPLLTVQSVCGVLFFVFFFLFYKNQFSGMRLSRKKAQPVFPLPEVLPRIAVLIPARNEERVIADLVGSLAAQDYPKDKYRVFVLADNCTDDTANAARSAGAEVFSRFDREKIGKGYALDALLSKIDETYGKDAFDAFAVFDADNLVKKDFLTEAVKVLGQGYGVVTALRNTKNYRGFPASGYALWFLRDSHLLNAGRMLSGIGANVSGTGYLFTDGFRKEIGGFPFHLLCEDLELTCYCALHGEIIGYADRAEFFDEQPTSYRDSVKQRIRWVKGGAQVFSKYFYPLTRVAFRKNTPTPCEVLFSIFPAAILTFSALIVHSVCVTVGFLRYSSPLPLLVFLAFLLVFYLVLFYNGLFTAVSCRKFIHARQSEVTSSVFLFPVFLFSFVPVAIRALFARNDWKSVRHTGGVSLSDLIS